MYALVGSASSNMNVSDLKMDSCDRLRYISKIGMIGLYSAILGLRLKLLPFLARAGRKGGGARRHNPRIDLYKNRKAFTQPMKTMFGTDLSIDLLSHLTYLPSLQTE